MTEPSSGPERAQSLGLALRSIVVGVDGSPPSDRAVAAAADLARAFRAQLTVVTAVTSPVVYPTDLGPVTGSREAVKALRQSSEELVARHVASLKKSDLAAEGVVREGSPTDVLLTVAEEKRADLLVVGSRGLSRTKRLLLGSVSMSIASAAPCPVLVVRDPYPEDGPSNSART